jgi:hypothetical protein
VIVAGRIRRRPKSDPTLAPARVGTKDKAESSDLPAKYDRGELDTNYILYTKSKLKKRPYDRLSDSEEAANLYVLVKSRGKRTRVLITDTDYVKGSD